MKKVVFFLVWILLFPSLAPAQDQPKLAEADMLKLINDASGGVELYTTPDIPVENRNQFDVDGDGIPEWFIVPKTACGETKNCQFFVIQYDKKKKKWGIILKADGKLTSLSPWGVIITPTKTKGYTDLLTVFDMGPERSGERSLERSVYVWNGKNYEKSSQPWPPPDAGPEVQTLLKEVDKLKRERIVKPTVE
ncbi:hypothetical protein FBR05_06880 [Deltaproteobacteria bacterium PRO3]|nr:hypothetical protein [Deltaproteobacteria bacterium PRO3]